EGGAEAVGGLGVFARPPERGAEIEVEVGIGVVAFERLGEARDGGRKILALRLRGAEIVEDFIERQRDRYELEALLGALDIAVHVAAEAKIEARLQVVRIALLHALEPSGGDLVVLLLPVRLAKLEARLRVFRIQQRGLGEEMVPLLG